VPYANTAYTVNVDFLPSYGAGTTSDIAIIKIPIRVQARTYSGWAAPGPNNAYDDVCKSMLTESVTFYYKPSGTHEVYAYVYKDFTGGVTASIALTSLSCQYYRVTGVGTSPYLWNAYYYSSDKLTMNQLALQVPDSQLGITNSVVYKWMGCQQATGCACGSCAVTQLFPLAGMQNDRGATIGATYQGVELIYSRNIIGATQQYSKWEVHRNLYMDGTNGITA
jgi:hypothetical protein